MNSNQTTNEPQRPSGPHGEGESEGAHQQVVHPLTPGMPREPTPIYTGAPTPIPVRPPKESNGDGKGNGDGSHGQKDKGGHHDAHHEENVIPDDLPKPSMGTILVVGAVAVVLLIALFLLGLIPHLHREHQAAADASEMANETIFVNVAKPKISATDKDIRLPADVRANAETALYPRTTGYLKVLRHDIGDHVEAGELLAVIAAPDVDAQLAQAKASLEQSKANVDKAQSDLDLAKRTFARYDDARKLGTGSITEQEYDEKKAAMDDAASALEQAKASVTASEANVEQLSVQQGFEKIYAPFAGVVTGRNYDVGAFLSPTNVTSGKEMFDVQQVDPLRVFVNVPQTYATNLHIGQPGFLAVRNYPGREFKGTLARTTGSLDPATRTIRMEVDFPNPKGELYAGMYGQARLEVYEASPPLVIPTSALVFNADGLQVMTVEDNKAHVRKIKVGRDMGTEIEVTDGVSPDDQVIANPGEKLAEGVSVTVAAPKGAPEGAPAAKKDRVAAAP